jgi:hypothetical protein
MSSVSSVSSSTLRMWWVAKGRSGEEYDLWVKMGMTGIVDNLKKDYLKEREYQYWNDRADCLDACDRAEYQKDEEEEEAKEEKKELEERIYSWAQRVTDASYDKEYYRFPNNEYGRWRAKQSAQKFAADSDWDLKIKYATAEIIAVSSSSSSDSSTEEMTIIKKELARRLDEKKVEDDGFSFVRQMLK